MQRYIRFKIGTTNENRPFFSPIHPLSLLKSHQLLSTGGVNSHAAVKVSLGRAHLHSNTEALEDLAAAEADNVQANNLLLGAGANELVRGRRLVFGLHHGVVHGSEVGLVDLEVLGAVLGHRLWLGKANGTNLRVREHNGWHILVAELGCPKLLGAEQTGGQPATGSNGNRGQLDVTAHITKSIDVLGAGVLVLIHHDVSLLVGLDASLVQAETLNRRCATNSPDKVVNIGNRLLTLALLEVERQLARRVLFNLGEEAPLVDLDSKALVLLY